LSQPRVVAELEQKIGHLVHMGTVEEILATVNSLHDLLAGLLIADLERASRNLVADALVFLAGLDRSLRLAASNVDDDVAEDPVGKRLRARPVDDRVLLELVCALPQARELLLEEVAEARRKPAALLERPVERTPPKFGGAHLPMTRRVLQET